MQKLIAKLGLLSRDGKAIDEVGQPLPCSLSEEEAKTRIKKLIERTMQKNNIPGLSIVVTDSSGVVLKEGFGKADGSDTPFTTETLSAIGSTSKLFTGFAIMKLFEEGKLDLDAPLHHFLPEFKPYSADASLDALTLRSVLSHQSGLQTDVYSGFFVCDSFKNLESRPYANLAAAASQTTLKFQPFRGFSYSNQGIGLLALVVEKVSGMSFNDYVRENILKPSGMRRSSFVFEKESESLYARGKLKGQWKDIPGIRDLAAGSMTSSASELGEFLVRLLKRNSSTNPDQEDFILSNQTLEKMWAKQNHHTPLLPDFEIGLSWICENSETNPQRKYLGHGGYLPPFEAILLVDPKLNVGVAILTNGGKNPGVELGKVAHEVLRLQTFLREGVNLAPIPKSKTKHVLTTDQKTRLVGNWATTYGLVSIRETKSKLKADYDGYKFAIEGKENNSVGVQYLLGGFVPLPLSSLTEVSLKLSTLDGKDYLLSESFTATKLQDENLHPAWQKRLGKWMRVLEDQPLHDVEKMVDFRAIEIAYDKKTSLPILKLKIPHTGFIAAKLKPHLVYPIASRGPKEIFTIGSGRSLGETFRILEEDGVEILQWSGLKFRKTGNK